MVFDHMSCNYCFDYFLTNVLVLFGMNLGRLGSRSTSERQLNRVNFRTVFKDRIMHSKSNIQEGLEPFSRPISKTSLDHYKSENRTANQNKTALKPENTIQATLQKLNFKHHNQDNCLCGACNCGRHLCKLQAIKPSFKHKSSYSLHFDKKTEDKSIKKAILLSKEVFPLKGPTLIKKSNYRNDFRTLQLDKLQKKRPQDSLKFQGPSQTLTSYAKEFHKFGGINQYIKHTERHSISHFPSAHKTSYSQDFKVKKVERTKSLKNKDTLQFRKLWLGQSVYSQNFIKPDNPEQTQLSNPLMQKSETLLKSLDFSHRFTTNYKRQFIQKKPVHCPSKILLNRSVQKLKVRHLLNQNGDFRGMNPQFKAIATSKHYYV